MISATVINLFVADALAPAHSGANHPPAVKALTQTSEGPASTGAEASCQPLHQLAGHANGPSGQWASRPLESALHQLWPLLTFGLRSHKGIKPDLPS